MQIWQRAGAVWVLALGACAPVPWDWTGGLEGDYLCKAKQTTVETRSSGATEESTSETDSYRITIESGADGLRGYVIGVACGAVPVLWSGGNLTLDGTPDCESKSTSGTTSRTDTRTKWKSLTVARTAPNNISLDGKVETETTSTFGTLSSVSNVTRTLKMDCKKVGRE